MVVLAVETVTRAGSLAICDEHGCDARIGDPSRTHGERLPAEALDWLREHGRTPADIDLLAVVTGPGSFTGMRIGIAAVQGMALAAHRRVVGVPTLEALAAAWVLTHPEPGLIVSCLDGQRGEVFAAAFVFDGATPVERLPEALAPIVGTPADIAERLASLANVQQDQRIVIVGDGATRYQPVFANRFAGAVIADTPMTLAAAAGQLARRRPELAGAPHALRPIYVRRPDAVMARERAGVRAPAAAPEGLTIARADGTEDLKAVEALQHQTFTNPWGVDAIRWELENTDVARLYIAREPGGALVAYCACWIIFDELHINSFAVDPAWRRRGIARQVLARVLDEAASSGVRAATLEVRRSNVAARTLYEGLGFQVEGTRRDYYQEPREDALILWNRALDSRTGTSATKSHPAV
jgi:tRNA threonylcarbamoyl adenosine modification protein YeaZ/ribosomal-protein-alanine acetyltransferase